MIWKHSKNGDLIISSEMSLGAPTKKQSVLPMASFNGQLQQNHGYHLLSTASTIPDTKQVLPSPHNVDNRVIFSLFVGKNAIFSNID